MVTQGKFNDENIWDHIWSIIFEGKMNEEDTIDTTNKIWQMLATKGYEVKKIKQ